MVPRIVHCCDFKGSFSIVHILTLSPALLNATRIQCATCCRRRVCCAYPPSLLTKISPLCCWRGGLAFPHRVRVQRGPSEAARCARKGDHQASLLSFLFLHSFSVKSSWREWPRLPSTARIGRALFHRARSASKEGAWSLPLSLLDLNLHPPRTMSIPWNLSDIALLLRRRMIRQLLCSRPRKILNVFQRIRNCH